MAAQFGIGATHRGLGSTLPTMSTRPISTRRATSQPPDFTPPSVPSTGGPGARYGSGARV